MRSLIFIISGLIWLPSVLISQTSVKDFSKPWDSGPKIRLSLFIPGISVETGIAKKITLFTEIGSGFSLVVSGSDGQFWMNVMYSSHDQKYSGTYFKLFPFAKIEERFYYNINRRIAANKPVANFTGNYISHYNTYLLNEMFTTGLTWGLQRNSKRFYFSLNVGLGVYFKNKEFAPDANNIEIRPAFINDVKLGFALN